jgi:hypothetical protein
LPTTSNAWKSVSPFSGPPAVTASRSHLGKDRLTLHSTNPWAADLGAKVIPVTPKKTWAEPGAKVIPVTPKKTWAEPGKALDSIEGQLATNHSSSGVSCGSQRAKTHQQADTWIY